MSNNETRRLVTGVDENGKSVFLADDQVGITALSNFPPGAGGFLLWGSNTQSEVPTTEPTHDYDTMFPPPTGYRYEIFNVMPDEVRAGLKPLDPEVLMAEMDQKLPGMREHMAPDGMHTTQTVDIGIVLDGEVWLELDDGAERLLRAGDVFVQNGTRHAWRNKSDQITRMAAVVIGADPAR
jgi:hypothetical protein